MKASLVTRMPIVTEHSPRDVVNAFVSLDGKEMEGFVLVGLAVYLKRTIICNTGLPILLA